MQRLDSTPAEAAVDLLSLDAETSRRVRAILAERTSTLDRIVRDGLRRFAAEVRDGTFPGEEESYP